MMNFSDSQKALLVNIYKKKGACSPYSFSIPKQAHITIKKLLTGIFDEYTQESTCDTCPIKQLALREHITIDKCSGSISYFLAEDEITKHPEEYLEYLV